jgi:hypothetical protein
MKRLNCWEYRKCGRNLEENEICPAATAEKLEGVNSGTAAGRVCWAVAGTLGTKECNLTFSEKITDCVLCDFYQMVLNEEEQFDIFPSDMMG